MKHWRDRDKEEVTDQVCSYLRVNGVGWTSQIGPKALDEVRTADTDHYKANKAVRGMLNRLAQGGHIQKHPTRSDCWLPNGATPT